ncbi:MAG: thioredoxin domain-containing protein [Bacteroidota bacterium]|nr:thioredoxin domain-containing protein [Bacteroidota bacterium]
MLINKVIITIAFTVALQLTQAQEKGIKFEHGITWSQVLAKAKTENKYIFVDCYTTWCGPCKQMDATVFPVEDVGNFFNKFY